MSELSQAQLTSALDILLTAVVGAQNRLPDTDRYEINRFLNGMLARYHAALGQCTICGYGPCRGHATPVDIETRIQECGFVPGDTHKKLVGELADANGCLRLRERQLAAHKRALEIAVEIAGDRIGGVTLSLIKATANGEFVNVEKGGMREQIGLTLHNVNNALSPLFMALEELEGENKGMRSWPLSPEDTRACLERIRNAMRDLKKAGGFDEGAEALAARWREVQAGAPLSPSVLPPDGPAQVVANRVMELVCQKCKHDFDFCDCPDTCRRCGEPCGPSLECTGDQIAACQARRGLPTLKAGEP